MSQDQGSCSRDKRCETQVWSGQHHGSVTRCFWCDLSSLTLKEQRETGSPVLYCGARAPGWGMPCWCSEIRWQRWDAFTIEQQTVQSNCLYLIMFLSILAGWCQERVLPDKDNEMYYYRVTTSPTSAV